MEEGLCKCSHFEIEPSSLTKYISKIKNVPHNQVMNHSFMPSIFHQKCIVVISVSYFPCLIAVCFGCDLFVNHHESDCKINSSTV